MALIKTIEEFQKYVRLQGTLNIETIIVSVPDAQDKYLRNILGDDLLNDLDTWYNMDELTDSDAYSVLLPYVQRALARFTIFVVSPELDVQITSSGIGVVSNANLAPASSDRVKKFDQANEQRGWNNVESLLRFLEENKDDYDEWTGSPAYTLAIRNMVNSAIDFDKIFSIDQSRLIFNQYRAIMDDIDLIKIKPAISEDMFDELITEIQAGEISDENQKILPLLQRAEVYFSISNKLDDSKYKNITDQVNITILDRDIKIYNAKAETFLSQALAIMKKTPDDYPEYRDSDVFDTTVWAYENKKDNTIFVMGGG